MDENNQNLSDERKHPQGSTQADASGVFPAAAQPDGSDTPEPYASGRQQNYQQPPAYSAPLYRQYQPYGSGQGMPPHSRQRSGRNYAWLYALIPVLVVIVLAAFVLGRGIGAIGNPPAGSPAAGNQGGFFPRPSVVVNLGADRGEPASNDIPDVVDFVFPSTVMIIAAAPQYSGNRIEGYSESGGSGVIVSQDGYIVTNEHVISGATDITAVLIDGTEYPAVLVGADERSDLAVIKIDAADLTPITFGDSSALRIGQSVIAIGSPIEAALAGTVTEGIVSSVEREIVADRSGRTILVIQHTAPINPGNSGGALVNEWGQLVGINARKTVVAGYGAYGNIIQAEGIGFAIPMSEVEPVVAQLISQGYVTRPWIGFSGITLTPSEAQSRGVPQGILVGEVFSDSPSEGRLAVNDVIIGVDGETIETFNELNRELRSRSPGSRITLTVYRNGDETDVEITLGEFPQDAL
ncbi:MAG: S1C family serine protease [Christensenellales bacterium]|jgi:serine protease Do